ncbi:hypothetical protein AMECASPLE_008023 [Ameca splendens]|uniref:Uncharacterized protein n=1 Tax=Ameca splendens TaxID=208324 RepID=A0ABV0Y092_9TELE
MLLTADESLTDAGVLTVLNAGVVAVDLRLMKIVHSSNLVLNQAFLRLEVFPPAVLAQISHDLLTVPAATDVLTLLCMQCCVHVWHGKLPTLPLPQCHNDAFRH